MDDIENLMSMNPAEITADIDEFGDPIAPATPNPEPPAQPEPPAPEKPLDPPAPAEPEVPAEPKKDETPAEPDKKVQTPEENARFAEQRRQQQLEAQVQKRLDELKQQSPEFQMAQALSKMYGKPVDQLYRELQEAALQNQAKAENVPVERLRAEQQQREDFAKLQAQMNQMRFDAWMTRVELEATTLQTKYPMLNAEDMNGAKEYLLETLKNPELPLDKAVFALHGEKISNGLRELAKQEALAELSGRSNSPLPPQGGKPSPTNTLTEDERQIAALMGVSEADYLANKY